MRKWYDPRWTKRIRIIMDTYLPTAIRDTKWFYLPIIRMWSPHMDPDFKMKAAQMTELELQAAYERLNSKRNSDMTPQTRSWVLEQLTGSHILEVGCGNGEISLACAKRGYRVMATDFLPSLITSLDEQYSQSQDQLAFKQANVESLPFPDKHFDTTLCLHTLEHVVDLKQAVKELKRVTRKRLIVIVPKQRFFRYTADYHLHFFASPSQLSTTLNLPSFRMEEIDFCLCYTGELSEMKSE